MVGIELVMAADCLHDQFIIFGSERLKFTM
jgi:hypothetical protein